MASPFAVRIKASALGSELSPYNFRAGDWEIGRAIFPPLLRFDHRFRLRPHVVASWEVSADLRRVELRLRDDLVFHNGRPVSARDLAYSLERGRGPGARPCFRELLADVAEIEITGELAVAISLRRPNRMFPAYFTRAALSLVPREELRPDDPWRWRAAPVGLGPYRIAERTARHLRLVAHPAFFGLHDRSPSELVFLVDGEEGFDLIVDDDCADASGYAHVPSPFWSTIAVEHYSFPSQDPDQARELRRLVNLALPGLPALEMAAHHPARCFVPPAFCAFQPEPRAQEDWSGLAADFSRRWGRIPPLWNILYEGYGEGSQLYRWQARLGAELRSRGLPVEDRRVARLDIEAPPGVHAFVLAASSFNYPDCDNLTLFFAPGGDIHRAATPELRRLRELLDRGRETAGSGAIYQEALRLLEIEGWIYPLIHTPEHAWVRRGFLDPGTIYGNSPHPFFEDLRPLRSTREA